MPKAKPNKPTIRSKCWKLLLEVHHVSAQEYISLVKQGKPQEYSKIRNDTFRTLATDRKFLDVVEEDSLIRVLCAFAWSTQGKNEWLLLPFSSCLFGCYFATTLCANRCHYGCTHYNDIRVFFIISHSLLLRRHQHFIISNVGSRYGCVVHICTGHECAGRSIPVHDDGDGGFLLLLQFYQELLSSLCPTNTSRCTLRHQGNIRSTRFFYFGGVYVDEFIRFTHR